MFFFHIGQHCGYFSLLLGATVSQEAAHIGDDIVQQEAQVRRVAIALQLKAAAPARARARQA
jgi:hypothetical protein